MKNIILVTLVLMAVSLQQAAAQGPRGKDFGFGIIVGEPLGGTIKLWFNRENALAASIGSSYFGSPRINADYLWHFDAFSSSIVKMYAGVGGAIGFGEGTEYFYRRNGVYYRTSDETGIGLRGVVGVNIIPNRSPVEIFLELGPLFGLTPGYHTFFDAALGVRFYP